MKSFTVAAVLASTAAALPASLPVPTCLPSGVVPSGVIPSGIPTCLPTSLPTGLPSGLPSSNNVGSVNNQLSVNTGHSHTVVTVTNQAAKNILVELEPMVASKLSSLNLGSLSSPIGTITQVAPSVKDLNLQGLGAGYLTVATTEGQVALVQLTSDVEALLAGLGLPQVGTLVGGLVGSLEGLTSGDLPSLKRGSLNNVLSITGLNGNNLLVQVEPTLFGLVSELPLVSSLEGPVGSVLAQVPAGSDLLAKASSIGADPSQLIAVLSQDGASALLVQVEGTLSGLLSTLGLSTVESTIGSVVPAGVLGLKRDALSNVLSITGLSGDNLLVQVEPTLFGLVSELPLVSSLEGPVGSVLAQVPAGSDLLAKASSIGADPSQLIAVLSQDGASALLVQVEGTLSGLLSTLGLSTVESTIGSVVPAGALGLKRDALSNVLSITGLNGDNLLVQVEPTLFGLVSELPLVSSLEGPVGSVLAQVPAGSDLLAKASSIGADPSQLIAVLSQDGASALLVQVEGTLSGLLSTLGLSTVESTIGSVVPAGALGLKRNAVNNVMSITNLNGENLLVQVEPTLFGLVSQLPLLSSLEGPVGSVLARVPAGSDLLSKATSLGADPSQLIAVLSQNGASVLLVQVEGALSGLLSTLGLSVVGSTIGSVVPAGAAGLL